MLRQTWFHAWAALLLIAAPTSAQQTTDDQGVPNASVGVSTWFSVVHIPAIANAPFSATTVMDNTQTLADGTTVTTKTMTTIARDSRGRTHNENRYYLRPSDNGHGRIRDVTIFDPTTRIRTRLTPATLQAAVTALSPKQPRSASPDIQPGPQREDLGSSSIGGLTVHGFRQSRTIPEGADGNDRPITITDEYWYSDELHMNITLKHTDPRHGIQFVTLTQLSRDEPDEKMFEVPAQYNACEEGDGQEPVKIAASAAAANLIERMDPVYPPLAQAARIQGSVELTVLIGKDGSVKTAQLVSGHPLLVNAAKDAVMQWKYRPALVNGNVVTVIARVILNFTPAAQNQ
jgi:TonB family protein